MPLGPDLVATGSPIFSMAPYVLIMAPTLANSAAGRPFCTSAVDICRNSAYCPASTRSNAFLASTVESWAGWAASRTERSGKMRSARIDMTLLSYSGAGAGIARVMNRQAGYRVEKAPWGTRGHGRKTTAGSGLRTPREFQQTAFPQTVKHAAAGGSRN